MKVRNLVLALVLMGLCFAELEIPEDQPVCKLYGIIQLFGTIGGILVASYAGFTLTSSQELTERNSAKNLIAGVVIGLIIIWVSPIVVKELVASGGVCGW